MSETILKLEKVTGGYGDTEILHDIDLYVERDEIVVIIGPNGAGKSTAIKSIFGLLNLTAGSVTLDGVDITNTPPEKVVRQGVCYVPQTSNIFPNLSVQENLEMGAYIRTDDFSDQLEKIYKMFPPLREKKNEAAGDLSGGQRQMVAMGKALMLEPKILLLDEPTAGLSPLFRSEIFKIVKQVHATGVPILMVEQNAKQALAIADRGYVLVDGGNKYEGTGQDLLNDPEVGEMFLGGGKDAQDRGTANKKARGTANKSARGAANKKTPAKKTAAKKTTAKRAPAKKAPAKRAAVKKPAARKKS